VARRGVVIDTRIVACSFLDGREVGDEPMQTYPKPAEIVTTGDLFSLR
jgi:hypothetical protein